MKSDSFANWFKEYKWRILLIVTMIIIGVLFITVGFWKTLLVIILAAIGFVLGYAKDRTEDFLRFIDKFR